ncbi:LacI family DNA-binding transcriptional regulator [Actinocatenispora rupis]|uniref:LacI family transcriptional regulator n=2 Tax=Actinocatenispora rupis TaxID=519421 RepID=A0A8J3ITR3_9ACTN|nr:LacI family transcriptional regulator [Actinocatenispora rupis]
MVGMPTIYDVARHAGVSPATVSRVLNGHEGVDAALTARVRESAATLGYRPNSLARNLRRSTTNLWAVIISDVNNPFFTAVVRGVEDAGQDLGYSVVLCNSDEQPDKEARYVTALLADQISGFIVSPTSRTANIRALVDAGRAVVAIDRRPRGLALDTVLVDNEHGAREATAHLIDQGYERIACITGPSRLSTASQRLRGFRAALRAAGRTPEPELERHADFRERGGYEAMADLAAARPDAVFVANNLMTVGALEFLSDKGIRVPDEVAVVGFDDVPWATFIRPPLSTVTQPTYELGRTAATLLKSRIDDPGRPPTVATLRTELHVRASSRRR